MAEVATLEARATNMTIYAILLVRRANVSTACHRIQEYQEMLANLAMSVCLTYYIQDS
jgi:hypothetical protein